MAWRAGIDTGGTFTDLVLVDDASGAVETVKVGSTPDDPAEAVLAALRRCGKQPEAILSIVLGTTIGTNAVLQRTGARVLYITTAGFEDIPHIQRADKPDPYDLQWEKPRPFVQRHDSLGVAERITPGGAVEVPLTDAELERVGDAVARWLDDADPSERAVAVNLLFSFAEPAHERRLGAHLAARFPGLPVSLSHEVAPLWREYERASTTILDAYVKPLLRRFVGRLEARLREAGYAAPVALIKSNGGRLLAKAATDQPAQLLLSGLAGGVIGGASTGARAGRRNLVTFDMGGTSTDVGLVVDGAWTYTTEYQLTFGIPVMVPTIDVVTIGAGGGSIAWIDKGGLLRVGPRSAGAVPGPAAYGRGGTEATVTDANLMLGRLAPDSLLGGELPLDLEAARTAVARLAARLGRDPIETARAILAIANENMANAIRLVTVERGLDPADFALVAFGGAGPLHAAEIAAALGMREVLVPAHPGLTSALGALLAPPRVDLQRTFVRRGAGIVAGELDATFRELEDAARATLRAEGHRQALHARRLLGLRYAGQNYHRDVEIGPSPLDEAVLETAVAEFHAQHERSHGYRIAAEIIEVTGCTVTVAGEPGTARLAAAGNGPAIAAGRRRVMLPDKDVELTPYQRGSLTAGSHLDGPLVLAEYDSTTLLLPGQTARVGEDGTLLAVTAGPSPPSRAFDDPVSLTIVNNALVNICREMGTAMIRTAYSPIFNESRDFSCALFDRAGQLLAQGEYCPAQLGAIVHTVRTVLDEWPVERFAPGDVIIHNDPYRGGCHMPEHTLLAPVFVDGQLVAYAAIIAHLAEIGGKVVGSFAADATEVFQEGLRLPPVRLMRGGERVQEVWDIILANHRTPRHSWGDLHAMLGALKVADERFRALCAKLGTEPLLAAARALLDHAERWMRAEIAAIPDGTYEHEDTLEGDGVATQPIRLHVRVTVAGDRIVADYTGSADQAKGPVNATLGVTMSATYNALYQLADKAIPRNAGCYRPIEVRTRAGSVLDVRYPGPSVGGNTETQPRIVFLVLGALAGALPDRISACEGCTACNFLIGGAHPETGEYYAHYHFEASGWGGRATRDGNSCQNHIIGNCRITPVEVFETRFPLRVLSYALRPDSGGPGRFRGGLGTRRVMRVLAPEIRASLLMDHAEKGPWPLFGGAAGATAGAFVRRAGGDAFVPFTTAFGVRSPSKFADVQLAEGDLVMLESAGGAGYGPPAERDPALVEADLREGFVSAEAADRLYGRR